MGLQSKESFLAWYDDEKNERMRVSTSALPTTAKDTEAIYSPPLSRNPVIIDVVKDAGYLGIIGDISQ